MLRLDGAIDIVLNCKMSRNLYAVTKWNSFRTRIEGAKDFFNEFIDEYKKSTQFPVKWNDLPHLSLRFCLTTKELAIVCRFCLEANASSQNLLALFSFEYLFRETQVCLCVCERESEWEGEWKLWFVSYFDELNSFRPQSSLKAVVESNRPPFDRWMLRCNRLHNKSGILKRI